MGRVPVSTINVGFRFAVYLLLASAVLFVSPAYALDAFPGTTITGSSNLTASNVGATSQTGEPVTFGGGSVNSMWYSWTAPSNGTFVVGTCSATTTNFDTTIGAYTGGAVNALTAVAINDDACANATGNLASQVSLSVTSGTTYRIQVDGYGSNTGTFLLTWVFTATAPPVPPAPTGTQVCSALTGAWSGGAATSGGIGVTRSLSASGGGSWSGATVDSMNTIAAFSSAAVQGNPSQVDTFNWTGPTSSTGDLGNYTITFAKPVTNPVIHIDRVGGVAATGQSNSSKWTLASSGTLTRLAGVGHFGTFSDNTFLRTVGITSAGTESSTNTATGTAAGSVMITGTHSSVTFSVSGLEPAGAAGGDAFEVVVCAPQADLSLAKSVNNPSPTVGQNVTYTITLTNSGADAAPGVVVTDILPAGLTFVSATPSQGSASNSSGTVTWNAGTVAVGGTAPTLQIQATVTSAGTITNTAQVTASTYVDPDSNPNDGTGDDFASVPITAVPGPPRITLTKISNGGVGGFTFTGNNGWASQTITTVTSGVGIAGATQTLTASATATTITEAAVAGYVMTGVACTGTGGGTQPTVNLAARTIAFTAAQMAAGANIACTVTNARQADLSLAKTVSNASPTVGSNITYTLTLTNGGPGNTTTTQVTDVLPAGLTFVSATPSQGSASNSSGTITWNVGAIASGGAPTLQIQATVTSAGTITNTAQVTASNLPDPDSTPNDGAGDDFASVPIMATASVGTGLPQCVGTNLVNNGGFESPITAPTTYQIISPNIPSWTTTDSGIEIWDTGYNGVPSHTGGQFAEINAYIAGTLTNSSATVHPRAEASVFWAHRGRGGTDVASLLITDNGGGSSLPPNFSTGTAAWVEYGATHVVSSTGTNMSLAFTAVSTGSGIISVGNFLDTVEICQTYITITKAFASKTDVDGSGADSAGDTVTYTFTVSNPVGNEKGLTAVEIVDDKIGTFAAVPIAGDDGDNILEPGETWTVNGTYSIAQADIDAEQVTNIAFARGDTGDNIIRSDDATETVSFSGAPSLSIVKSYALNKGSGNSAPDAEAGDTIVYTYIVTNTGNQTISNVEVDDSGHTGQGSWVDPAHTGAITTDNGPIGDSPDSNGDATIWGTLAPLDVITFTSNYVVTQADIDGQM